MVAFGTIFSGLSTFSAGIVADSTPKKAYKVNAATTGNVAKLLPSVKLKAGKLSKLKKKTPLNILSNFRARNTGWNGVVKHGRAGNNKVSDSDQVKGRV